MRWSGLVDPVLDSEVMSWRRHLHAHLELSSQELEVTAFVEEKIVREELKQSAH
jgi:metal-dependent amidase/aminoacylase/carboxypeptidase family protein